jgi:hypothetical protein
LRLKFSFWDFHPPPILERFEKWNRKPGSNDSTSECIVCTFECFSINGLSPVPQRKLRCFQKKTDLVWAIG